MISLGCALAAVLLSPAGSDAIADELSRLDGHRYTVAEDGASYTIDDVAGEGAPIVGVVARRDGALWLDTGDGGAWKLRGPLAVPRIAGPGYKVWVLGDHSESTRELAARRIGILRPPATTAE